ncbi:endochitinase Ziz m 1.0101-like [Ziziphus jujuba]|uniref:chitinase n=1 Tax=Ziziphus jujuba TaxID=326968 RepID=A0ABM3IE07_ZIZJJ|nr:endochitinase Ziz m 1.0101-like [Ziziphus jujuba]
MAPLAKLVMACLILSSTLVPISEAGSIVTYWGQYTNKTEGTLEEACESGLYSYINVAFLNQFGYSQDLVLNLSGHYSNGNYTLLGEEIKACQKMGFKVLLSLGGPYGNYSLASSWDAETVSGQLWSLYLDANSTSSALGGGAAFDGIDFHIERGSPLYYYDLAKKLKEHGAGERNKTIYLSAAPRCLYPDEYLAKAINESVFDFVWVLFYGGSVACEYNAVTGLDNLIISWNAWSLLLKKPAKLFLGVTASQSISGYIPPGVLKGEVIPQINETSRFEGVMVWNRYYDLLTDYSSSIVNDVNLIKLKKPLRNVNLIKLKKP